MKKLLFLGLIILLSLSLILSFSVIGCKQEAAPEEEIKEEASEEEASVEEKAAPEEVVTISMSVWGMPWEDLLYTDILIPMFEEQNPNIKIEFVRFEDYFTKLITLYAGDEAPDVMRNHIGDIGNHILFDMLMPLEGFINGEDGVDMSQYVDGYYDSMSYGDDKYVLPIGLNNGSVLAYNMELFDSAGLDYPTSDWTITDLEEAAKKLTSGDEYGFYWEINSILLTTLFSKTGADPWTGDNMDELPYSQGMVDAVELMQKWVFDDQITPIELGAGESRESALQLFQSGRLGMLTMGGWQIPSIKFNAPDLKFGVAPFPASDMAGPGGMAMGTNFSMSANTEHPDEAWKLMKFLCSAEGVLKYWQHTYVETPANIAVRENPEFKNILGMEGNVLPITDEEEFNQKLGVHMDIAENGWYDFNFTGGPYYPQTDGPMSALLDQTIGVERGDAETAIRAFLDDVNASIKDSQY